MKWLGCHTSWMKFLPVLSAEDDTTGDANRHEKNKLAPRAHLRTCQLEAGVRGQMPYTVVNWAVETVCAWELSRLRAVGVESGPPNRKANCASRGWNGRKMDQSFSESMMPWSEVAGDPKWWTLGNWNPCMVKHHDWNSCFFLVCALPGLVFRWSWAKLSGFPNLQDEKTGLSNIMSKTLALLRMQDERTGLSNTMSETLAFS